MDTAIRRVYVLADLQLDAGRNLGPVPHGPGSRLDDQRRMLFAVAATVRADTNARAVVIAGDVFEDRRPTPAALEVLGRFLGQLSTVPVELLVGNHDVSGPDYPSPLDAFAESVPNVRVHHSPGVFAIAGAAFAFLPWTHSGRMLAQLDEPLTGNVHEQMRGALVATAQGLAVNAAQLPGPSVLVTHWAIDGASLIAGLQLPEPVLPARDLEHGFDVVLAGHLHRPEHLGERTHYVGSPWVVDYGEASWQHRYLTLDVLPEGPPVLTSRPVTDRPFVTVDVRADEHDDDVPALVLAECERQLTIGAGGLGGPCVRVRVRVPAEQAGRVDRHAIRERLLNAGAWSVPIVDVILEGSRVQARVADLTADLAPTDALARWLEANEPDPDRRARALAAHASLEHDAPV